MSPLPILQTVYTPEEPATGILVKHEMQKWMWRKSAWAKEGFQVTSVVMWPRDRTQALSFVSTRPHQLSHPDSPRLRFCLVILSALRTLHAPAIAHSILQISVYIVWQPRKGYGEKISQRKETAGSLRYSYNFANDSQDQSKKQKPWLLSGEERLVRSEAPKIS